MHINILSYPTHTPICASVGAASQYIHIKKKGWRYHPIIYICAWIGKEKKPSEWEWKENTHLPLATLLPDQTTDQHFTSFYFFFNPERFFNVGERP